jgi:hypothetical protein
MSDESSKPGASRRSIIKTVSAALIGGWSWKEIPVAGQQSVAPVNKPLYLTLEKADAQKEDFFVPFVAISPI